jgi:putative lipoprotein
MMNKRILLYLSITLILFLLSACSAIKGSDALDGTAWQLVAMGEDLPLPESTLTIVFEDGQAGGSSGCNSYGGAYTIQDDQFGIKDIASTLMACLDAGLMEQEQAYLAFLGEVTGYSLREGMLYLTRPDGSSLRFIPQP